MCHDSTTEREPGSRPAAAATAGRAALVATCSASFVVQPVVASSRRPSTDSAAAEFVCGEFVWFRQWPPCATRLARFRLQRDSIGPPTDRVGAFKFNDTEPAAAAQCNGESLRTQCKLQRPESLSLASDRPRLMAGRPTKRPPAQNPAICSPKPRLNPQQPGRPLMENHHLRCNQLTSCWPLTQICQLARRPSESN